uniref:Protein kinase domain-containing protein n=1 Tax=Romanomermis culicivorax TaxID=13658 RepID=A0A915IQK5_ROMCU
MTGCLNLIFTMERATQSDFRDQSVSNWSIIKNLRLICMDFDYVTNLTGDGTSSERPAAATFVVDLEWEKVKKAEPPIFVLWIREKLTNNITSPLDFHRHSMIDNNNTVYTRWNFVGTEIDSTFTIRYLWPKIGYQLRVQAVNSLQLGPPFDGQLFNFGEDPTCFYSLTVKYDGFHSRKSLVFQTTNTFSFTFENLEFDQNCFIIVEPIWNYSKTKLQKTISLRTPSCAAFHHEDFDICGKDRAGELELVRTVDVMSLVKDTSLRIFDFQDVVFSKYEKELHPRCSYRVGVSALTKGGEGIPFEENFTVRKVFEPTQQEVFFVRWMILVAFALLCLPIIGGSLSCYFLQLNAKKNAKKIDELEQYSQRLIGYDPERSEKSLARNRTYYESESKDIFQDTQENSTLNNRFLIVDSLLGTGEFGSVYRARCTHPRYPNVVAVKKVKVCEDTTEPRKHLENEIALMKFIGRHENIVSFFGANYQPEMTLTMEFCFYGNLKCYLPTIKSQLLAFKKPEISPGADSGYGQTDNLYAFPAVTPLTASEYRFDDVPTRAADGIVDSALLLKFAHQIASGMEHIADLGLIHCDLAARNVLVAEKCGGGEILKTRE